MRYAIVADNGKRQAKIASDEYLDLDIKDGNKFIARLTVRDGKIYDENDLPLHFHDFDNYGKCMDCKAWNIS